MSRPRKCPRVIWLKYKNPSERKLLVEFCQWLEEKGLTWKQGWTLDKEEFTKHAIG